MIYTKYDAIKALNIKKQNNEGAQIDTTNLCLTQITEYSVNERVLKMVKAIWIYRNGKWICSNCKEQAIMTNGKYWAITHYCGNCGKKMSVEETEQ